MTFQFVDILENDIASFLYTYNHKAFALNDSPAAISYKLPDDVLTDDLDELWGFGERSPRIDGLRKRLEKCWKDCEHIAIREPLLIDKADNQIHRIQQLSFILHFLENNEPYTKWEAIKLTKGVDLNCLPHVSRVIKGYAVDSIIQKAKSWADEGNHGEEGAAGFAVCLLMNELDMSRVQSVNTLKENGNRIFINVNTEGSIKKKSLAVESKYRTHYPETNCDQSKALGNN